ncbi:Glucan 1,4-alpha-maltohexaosidase [Niastella koreensis GR20-10]|uniref:Glucan 1,4-alpha-maltohexaosidase n=2 Tax=Niastella koreensis TaxID=354356 RepID=G8TFT2_NIAKG|nr:Glucan 1,4-alpha-maltohexaosidase [Niastella koreensis GR20-10]
MLIVMTNGTIIQFFHWYYPADGSLWDHARDKAAELAKLGITACWLPPACKAQNGPDASGYDAYDLYDLGEFDQKGSVRTKYGTKEAYLGAIHTLNEKGIGVYADVVLNHKGGADEKERITVIRVNEEDRNEQLSEPFEIEAYTRFTFPGRKGKYSAFIWDHHCFTGVDYAADLQESSIFRIRNEYGDNWEDVVASEKGNYDFLMCADIEFRNPAVRDELKRWGEWFLKEAPFAGVRLDAVKHMSPAFIVEWLDHMRSLKPDLFAVGEYWAPEDLPVMLQFLEATQNKIALFDAPLHRNFFDASNKGKEYDLRNILKNSILETNPSLAVTIVANHDTQPVQLLEAPIQPWFRPLAYSLVLLREAGYPCVFYPDLYGAQYTIKDADGKAHEIKEEPCAHLPLLLTTRKLYGYGKQRDYFDAPDCIGWTREGIADQPGSGCAVVLSTGDAATKKMEMGAAHAGKVFVDCLGNRLEPVTIDEPGWAEFPVNAGSVSVWIEKHN